MDENSPTDILDDSIDRTGRHFEPSVAFGAGAPLLAIPWRRPVLYTFLLKQTNDTATCYIELNTEALVAAVLWSGLILLGTLRSGLHGEGAYYARKDKKEVRVISDS